MRKIITPKCYPSKEENVAYWLSAVRENGSEYRSIKCEVKNGRLYTEKKVGGTIRVSCG